jgi:acetyl-CoA carboxylase carboxyltransferase component
VSAGGEGKAPPGAEGDRVADFNSFRERMNDRILGEDNQVIRRFFSLDTQTYRAGALDADALNKEREFVDLCDSFNLPLVFLHDVPGLMVGTAAEKSGILKAYERLALRIATATVPKVGVVIRKAYGGGHFAMGGRPTHPDFLFAWPSAELGFMAPDTGVRTVYRRRIDKVRAEQGEAAATALADELRREWETESEPWEAAAHLAIDDVIEPAATRDKIALAIDYAWGVRAQRVAP